MCTAKGKSRLVGCELGLRIETSQVRANFGSGSGQKPVGDKAQTGQKRDSLFAVSPLSYYKITLRDILENATSGSTKFSPRASPFATFRHNLA